MFQGRLQRRRIRFGAGILVILFLQTLQGQDSYDIPAHYSKFEYLVPMRDGVRLFTSVYVPKDRSQSYPLLLNRTPYSVGPYGPDAYKSQLGPHEGFAREGFIFVYQDVRGRYMSEGEFVNMRPYRPDKSGNHDIDENTDTYDTVEWLLKHVSPNNGRVGLYGTSYPGFYAAYGIIDGHPGIKAASPQAPIGDWFIGDDWHHHGAFFLMDAFNFYSSFGQPRPRPTTKRPPGFEYPVPDVYRFFLELGPLSNVNARHFRDEVQFWSKLMEHGTYDDFWKQRNIVQHMKGVRAAVMTVAGLFDAEDPFGPIQIYRKIEKENPGIPNTLVLGPWVHGGWNWMDGDQLGNVRFHVETGRDFRNRASLPFFQHYLKEKESAGLPEALVFVTGSNSWNEFSSWPPEHVEREKIFLHAGGTLSFLSPETGEGQEEYISDPANPVPYTSEIQARRRDTYMVEDQRFAARRPDVLAYASEVLERDVTVVGPVTSDLYVSTSGTDADFVVKLIDIYPDDTPEHEGKERDVPMGGYQMLVRGEVFRSKFRNSYEKPEALVPEEITRIRFDMPDIAHTFKAGHRIMVQIQSSWFPLVDRNPQTFVDIYSAERSDFRKATHRIHSARDHASHLELLVLQ